MISDFHLHTSYSGDSDTPMKDMIERGIHLGLPAMCFTDHFDMDYPKEPELFLLDTERYYEDIMTLKHTYKNEIELLFGVELGLQPHLGKQCTEFVRQFPFDFIIGSSHVVNGIDPYYPAYYENRSEEEAYTAYFASIIDNLQTFSDFDVYGHIDYVVRYGPHKNLQYSYERYKDILDNILKLCIEKGIGIELNTGGLAYGLGQPHPHPDIIQRYRQLGGEILTIGSDAHSPDRLAYEFSGMPELLKQCGFSYYTIFKKRKAEFVKL